MFRYVVVQEDLFSPELGWYRSYGIGAENNKGEQITFVSDVSLEKVFTEEIAKRCTKGQLAPDQLLDVIFNFI